MVGYTLPYLFFTFELFQIHKSFVLAQNDETKLATDECNTKHNELSSRILFMANCKKAVGVPDSDDVNKEKHECYIMRRYCAMKCVNEGKCPVTSLFTLNLNVFAHGSYKTLDCSCIFSQYKPGCRNDYSETWANVEKEFAANCTSDGATTTEETGNEPDPYKNIPYFTNDTSEWPRVKDCFSDDNIKDSCKNSISTLKSKGPFCSQKDSAVNGPKWYGLNYCTTSCGKCNTEAYYVAVEYFDLHGSMGKRKQEDMEEAMTHMDPKFFTKTDCILESTGEPGVGPMVNTWSGIEDNFIKECCKLRSTRLPEK